MKTMFPLKWAVLNIQYFRLPVKIIKNNCFCFKYVLNYENVTFTQYEFQVQ